MNKIDGIIEYAIDLADIEFSHEFEDLIKLAYLCEEIEELIQQGCEPESKKILVLFDKLGLLNRKSGRFRQAIEGCPLAKQLVRKAIASQKGN